MSKTAFITGAGGYIGAQTAIAFAKEKINVAVCDINEKSVKKAVDKVNKAGANAIGYVCDVTKLKDIEKATQKAAEDFGSLDIMVHIAGGSARIAGGKYVLLTQQEESVIDKVLKVNLYGAFWSDRAAAKIMMKQKNGGKIINFASAVGLNGLAGCCDYAAAKGGIMSLTKSLAKELGQYKINVNAVAPGIVQRPDEEDIKRALNTNYLGEKCTAEDIANLVVFLASDKARFITGQTYACDGGRTLAMKGND